MITIWQDYKKQYLLGTLGRICSKVKEHSGTYCTAFVKYIPLVGYSMCVNCYHYKIPQYGELICVYFSTHLCVIFILTHNWSVGSWCFHFFWYVVILYHEKPLLTYFGACVFGRKKRKEMGSLFNDTLNTFYLLLYGRKGGKEMFYLTTHSTHFIYGYMVSDIW